MIGGDYMTINLKPVGKMIKEIRKLRCMTQAQLAELTEMSDVFVSRIETGDRMTSLTSLIKIAVAFDVTLNELVRLDEVVEMEEEQYFIL